MLRQPYTAKYRTSGLQLGFKQESLTQYAQGKARLMLIYGGHKGANTLAKPHLQRELSVSTTSLYGRELLRQQIIVNYGSI